MFEREAAKSRETVEDLEPVTARLRVTDLVLQSATEFDGVEGRDDGEVVAVHSNALENLDEKADAHLVGCLVEQQPLKATGVGEWLRTVQVLVQEMHSVTIDGQEFLAFELDRADFQQGVELWLVCKRGTPGHRKARRCTVEERTPWRLAAAEVLEDAVLGRAGHGTLVASNVVDVDCWGWISCPWNKLVLRKHSKVPPSDIPSTPELNHADMGASDSGRPWAPRAPSGLTPSASTLLLTPGVSRCCLSAMPIPEIVDRRSMLAV